jgi:hypothetical protein
MVALTGCLAHPKPKLTKVTSARETASFDSRTLSPRQRRLMIRDAISLFVSHLDLDDGIRARATGTLEKRYPCFVT